MTREERLEDLISEYAPDDWCADDADRYALVSLDEEYGNAFITTHATIKDACSYAGDDDLHWVPTCIVDLDTGNQFGVEVEVKRIVRCR